ncbi:RhuM family protein [Pseudanabaena minima]|uniref:RhuM family protein n=1 Tax=Pseudanabaena minima TaxID=890415 RepID=UPI003DA9C2D8
MNSKIEIYQSHDNQVQVEVTYENDTFWLSLNQITELFGRDKSVISRHLKNIFKEGELLKESVVAKNATTAADGKIYQVEYFNLDAIISVGYRVNSKQGTQFRQWATQRLKDYLVQGYAINQKRLEQKNQEIQHLKDGIKILSRAIEAKTDNSNELEYEILKTFAKGLELLDNYDHEKLDQKGNTTTDTIYPDYEEYIELITEMYSDFESDIFAKPKDDSFHSSINQIKQSFGGEDLYPTLEEKAANLLYFIVKNHSFIDGNKRIGAACFLYFLQRNNILLKGNKPIIDNEALATLTLFIASSKTSESDTVKHLIISILNG